MSVEWTAESKTIELYEGDLINATFSCETNVEEGHSVEIVFLSSTLPASIQREVIQDGNNISGLKLTGSMPSILNEETYRLVARLQEYHTIGSSKIIDYMEDAGISIINKTMAVSWKDGYSLPIAYAKTAYSEELASALNNPNGNETYRKSSGTLPASMTLYPNGVLSGTPLMDEITEYDDPNIPDKPPYEFGVTVYKNNEIILPEKLFYLTIKKPNPATPPTWITESGMIGSVKAADVVSGIKVIATITVEESYPPEDKVIIYKLIGGELPPGLNFQSLNNQGIISGTVATNQVKTYNFTICPYRHYNGQWYPEDPEGSITELSFEAARSFYIVTNKPEPEHEIIWGNEDESIDGGSFQVGAVINDALPKAVAADGYPITYTVVDYGTLPTSISIELNGDITGTAQLPMGTYYCFVRASTEFTYVIRRVEIKVIKGLGYNSLNLYLRINNEYKDQYNEIRNQLNPTATYGNGQEGYEVAVFPKIDIATLSCFDREILAGIFNYGNPEIVRFLETSYKTYTDENVNGDATATYEAYYKIVDENTYQWDEIDNGNFDYEAELQKQQQLTASETGLSYETPPFYPMEADAELEFNNEYYNSSVNQKQWVLDRETPEGKKLYKLSNVYITTTPRVSYKIFNFKNVREALQKKIYVYKKAGDYYFDLGNQQLFEKSNITIKKLIEKKKDNDFQNNGEYEYSNKAESYLYYSDTDQKTKGNKELSYYISNEDGTNEEPVIYKEYNVYNSNGELITNTLFKPTFDTHQFMISSENNERYELEEISNPWCLDLNKSENKWLSMDKIPAGKEMVLPRISDDDVSDDGTYIQMLDTKVEPLPKWKRKEAIYWEAETVYNVGDIIYYDTKYYLVIKKFKTEYAFEYDTQNMRLLSNDEVKEQLSKQYFPTLDLGYYKAGKNRNYLKNLNAEEKKGKYWYRKDFFFWEVVCEPLYNESIEQFGVPFYSTDKEENDGDEYGKKTFELIVNNPASDYTVTITVNGMDIITAPESVQEIYEYTHTNNSYKITVNYGTTVEWSVSAGDIYTSEDGVSTMYTNEIKNISLIKKVYDLVDEDNNSLISEEGHSLVSEEYINYDEINNNGD